MMQNAIRKVPLLFQSPVPLLNASAGNARMVNKTVYDEGNCATAHLYREFKGGQIKYVCYFRGCVSPGN